MYALCIDYHASTIQYYYLRLYRMVGARRIHGLVEWWGGGLNVDDDAGFKNKVSSSVPCQHISIAEDDVKVRVSLKGPGPGQAPTRVLLVGRT